MVVWRRTVRLVSLLTLSCLSVSLYESISALIGDLVVVTRILLGLDTVSPSGTDGKPWKKEWCSVRQRTSE